MMVCFGYVEHSDLFFINQSQTMTVYIGSHIHGVFWCRCMYWPWLPQVFWLRLQDIFFIKVVDTYRSGRALASWSGDRQFESRDPVIVSSSLVIRWSSVWASWSGDPEFWSPARQIQDVKMVVNLVSVPSLSARRLEVRVTCLSD
jgi:hypothetical protein